MSDFNVINAHLTGRTVCTTKTVYQYSRGMELHIYDNGLPDNYRVEFANSVTGTSTGQLCTDGVVSVPTQYFVPGSTIYAWVVMVSAEYDVPIKTITIPIAIKAQYVDAEPAPEPTSIIDEAIAALNDAVSKAEVAVSHYPTIIENEWYVWDVESEDYIATGVTAAGNGISSAVLNADYTLTLTFTDGTSYTTPSIRGEKGETGDSGVYVGTTEPTDPDVNVWINPEGGSTAFPVRDVQAAGVSVVSNGIAKIPNASSATKGVVQAYPNGGLQFVEAGKMAISYASSITIKQGSNAYQPITPNVQHYATFYGLAKAANDTSQYYDYSLPFGTYTTTAKSKISQMLNAPCEVSGQTPTIQAESGVTYKCGEVSTLAISLPASGDVEVIFTSGSTATVLTVTPASGVTSVKWADGFDPTSLDANTRYDLIFTDGEWGVAASWAV